MEAHLRSILERAGEALPYRWAERMHTHYQDPEQDLLTLRAKFGELGAGGDPALRDGIQADIERLETFLTWLARRQADQPSGS
jgi:hypothetical protein